MAYIIDLDKSHNDANNRTAALANFMVAVVVFFVVVVFHTNKLNLK